MSDLAWWAGVMAVSLALTAASAYLVPWIESALGALTAKRSTRTARGRAAREARIRSLAASAEARMDARYEVLRHLLVGIMFVTYAFGLLLLAFLAGSGRAATGISALVRYVPLVFAAVFTPLGTRYLMQAATLHHELREARDSLSPLARRSDG
jgi:hypothetical protein